MLTYACHFEHPLRALLAMTRLEPKHFPMLFRLYLFSDSHGGTLQAPYEYADAYPEGDIPKLVKTATDATMDMILEYNYQNRLDQEPDLALDMLLHAFSELLAHPALHELDGLRYCYKIDAACELVQLMSAVFNKILVENRWAGACVPA